MVDYDLCLIWYWEYDSNFVAAIRAACSAQNVSFWPVSPENLIQATTDLLTGQANVRVLLDRSQYHAGFLPFLQKAMEAGAYVINPLKHSHPAEKFLRS
jgi:hypothetical protein